MGFSLENFISHDSRQLSALKIWIRKIPRYSQAWKFEFARFPAILSLENLNSQDCRLVSALKIWIRKIPGYSQPWKINFARFPAVLSLENWAQHWKLILALRMGFSLENLNSQDSPLFSALKIWIRKIPRYSQPRKFEFARFPAILSLDFLLRF